MNALHLASLGGTDAVAFETLTAGGETVAEHADIDDEDQTVYLRPEVSTEAKAGDGGDEVDAKADQRVADTVHIAGLRPGASYTLAATPMDRATGEAIALDRDADGADPDADLPEGTSVYEVLANGTVSFTPTATELDVPVPVTLDASELAGHSVVMFESLSRDADGEEIASHEDIDDEAQTVTVRGAASPMAQTGALPPAIALLAAAAAAGAVYVATGRAGRPRTCTTDQFGRPLR